jgi:hypothetical protein
MRNVLYQNYIQSRALQGITYTKLVESRCDVVAYLPVGFRDDNPAVFLEHKLPYFTKDVVPSEDYTVPFGSGQHPPSD